MTENLSENEIVERIADHYREIIRLIGEDPSREGLVKTPLRAAKALYYVTSGYRADLRSIVNEAVFTHCGSKMIIVRDIEFYSLCEHHILPFFGKISIGYIPDGKMLGLSKLARIVDMYARRLQVQERFTAEVCRSVMEAASAKGVIAVCNASHLCMKMRGVEKQDSSTTTIECCGVFESDQSLTDSFFRSLGF